MVHKKRQFNFIFTINSQSYQLIVPLKSAVFTKSTQTQKQGNKIIIKNNNKETKKTPKQQPKKKQRTITPQKEGRKSDIEKGYELSLFYFRADINTCNVNLRSPKLQ